jgi:alkaline phosphatase
MKQWIFATAMVAALAACATVSDTQSRGAAVTTPQGQDAYFTAGAARAAAQPASGRARNVILFVGDGMGVSTVTAARIFAGQQLGVDGESYELSFDTFPFTALSRTYSHDFQISDSAATITAMTSGVKTRSGAINVTADAPETACGWNGAGATRTLFEIAEAQGMSTGVISTARLTHATPAGAFAHVANRGWEADADLPEALRATCPDIARQLIEWPAGDGFEVILGGGRANFLPAAAVDPEQAAVRGRRLDGRDLAAEWAAASPNRRYVWNAAGFAETDFDSDVQVLGLFSPSHMAYDYDRPQDVGGEPTLAEMTTAAIRRLSRDDGGYVLLVEAGRVDHAHHDGMAFYALSEAVALDAAVRAALAATSREDTLILVTADHSHAFTISGYARRGNPILGLSDPGGGPTLAADGRPYTTLGYANGPGSIFAGVTGATERPAPDAEGVLQPGYRQQALTPLSSETHGGEDVAIYAWGPGAAAYTGTLEQNVIFHNAARALGWDVR